MPGEGWKLRGDRQSRTGGERGKEGGMVLFDGLVEPLSFLKPNEGKGGI